MLIYLADLYHTFSAIHNQDSSPYTVPLGIGYVAAAIERAFPDVKIRLFRDPDRLLAAVCSQPPDLLGLSVTSWNTDLSRRAAEFVKKRAPGCVTVAGGPCVDDTDEQIIGFLRSLPAVDYVVPGEGEEGAVALVKHLKGGGKSRDGAVVPACAYLNGDRLSRGVRTPSATSADIDADFPSPYLNGMLDSFLAEGCVPILQTMRGCPYRCEFCVSGTLEWSKAKAFSHARVTAEIERALTRSASKDLILTDENWGLLGERDLAIARHIMDRNKRVGSPNRLYYYTAKVVNDASRAIVEMVAPIAWIGEFTMSFQSLNEQTRTSIRRTNIPLDKLAFNLDWANKRGIRTSSEMIYGFPYETTDTFFTGVETLLDAGIHKVQVYPLQLFGGIDLSSPKARENYALGTRYRLADSAHGSYADGALTSVETEEVVVSTRWSSIDGFYAVRRYGLFMEVLWGREYFTELTRLCHEAGFSLAPLIRHLTMADYTDRPALKAVMADYQRDIASELLPTHEAVFEQAAAKLKRGEPVMGVKINFVYLGRIFSSPKATAEVLALVEGFISAGMAEGPEKRVILTYLREVATHRIVLLDSKTPSQEPFASSFDYAKWAERRAGPVGDLLLSAPRRYAAALHPILAENLRGFDPADTASLQALYDKTPTKHLMRSVSLAS